MGVGGGMILWGGKCFSGDGVADFGEHSAQLAGGFAAAGNRRRRQPADWRAVNAQRNAAVQPGIVFFLLTRRGEMVAGVGAGFAGVII